MFRTRKALSLAAFCLGLAFVSAGPSAPYLNAQEELEVVDPGDGGGEYHGCALRTRWKDAFGKCPSCCDAATYACPCTV